MDAPGRGREAERLPRVARGRARTARADGLEAPFAVLDSGERHAAGKHPLPDVCDPSTAGSRSAGPGSPARPGAPGSTSRRSSSSSTTPSRRSAACGSSSRRTRGTPAPAARSRRSPPASRASSESTWSSRTATLRDSAYYAIMDDDWPAVRDEPRAPAQREALSRRVELGAARGGRRRDDARAGRDVQLARRRRADPRAGRRQSPRSRTRSCAAAMSTLRAGLSETTASRRPAARWHSESASEPMIARPVREADHARHLLGGEIGAGRLEREHLDLVLRARAVERAAVEEGASASPRRPLLAAPEVVDVAEVDVAHRSRRRRRRPRGRRRECRAWRSCCRRSGRARPACRRRRPRRPARRAPRRRA